MQTYPEKSFRRSGNGHMVTRFLA